MTLTHQAFQHRRGPAVMDSGPGQFDPFGQRRRPFGREQGGGGVGQDHRQRRPFAPLQHAANDGGALRRAADAQVRQATRLQAEIRRRPLVGDICPSRTSRTKVGADRLTSSRPSRPQTSRACRVPRRASAPAMRSRCSTRPTPSSWYGARAGLASGPSQLNSVRTPSRRRTAATALAAPVKVRCEAERHTHGVQGNAARSGRRPPRPLPVRPARRRCCRCGWSPRGCRVSPPARLPPPPRRPWPC